MMNLIVGLGNPGPRYLMTRHNVGFLAVDAWLQGFDSPIRKNEHQAETFKILKPHQVLAVKPQTFMNLSGQSVLAIKNFYKIELDKILVIQDDLDQPLGSMKFQKNRGHGGQNGIRHISEVLGTQDYARLKIGIGPVSPTGEAGPKPPDAASYVLGNFQPSEEQLLASILEKTCEAIDCFIESGIDKASTMFNSKPKLGSLAKGES